jgi:hypothetical protein
MRISSGDFEQNTGAGDLGTLNKLISWLPKRFTAKHEQIISKSSVVPDRGADPTICIRTGLFLLMDWLLNNKCLSGGRFRQNRGRAI